MFTGGTLSLVTSALQKIVLSCRMTLHCFSGSLGFLKVTLCTPLSNIICVFITYMLQMEMRLLSSITLKKGGDPQFTLSEVPPAESAKK